MRTDLSQMVDCLLWENLVNIYPEAQLRHGGVSLNCMTAFCIGLPDCSFLPGFVSSRNWRAANCTLERYIFFWINSIHFLVGKYELILSICLTQTHS